MTDRTRIFEALPCALLHAMRNPACWASILRSRSRTLVVFALVIAVASWSSGTRISRFLYNIDHSHRVPLARALPELRFAEAAPDKIRLRYRSHGQTVPAAIGPLHGLQRIAHSLAARVPLALSARRHFFFKAALPLRSPPALALA